jgi:hypothetical protein
VLNLKMENWNVFYPYSKYGECKKRSVKFRYLSYLTQKKTLTLKSNFWHTVNIAEKSTNLTFSININLVKTSSVNYTECRIIHQSNWTVRCIGLENQHNVNLFKSQKTVVGWLRTIYCLLWCANNSCWWWRYQINIKWL